MKLFTAKQCRCRLPVNSSHGHLVMRSCRHTVNSAPVNSSHMRLVTQSTRHIIKPPQCRAVRFRCLGLMSLYHSNWLMTTFICGRWNLKETRRCTYMYNMASYCSVCNIEVIDDSEALECDKYQVKKYGQLVTTPSDTTVNSAHHFTVWQVDRVTSWLVPQMSYTKSLRLPIFVPNACTDAVYAYVHRIIFMSVPLCQRFHAIKQS